MHIQCRLKSTTSKSFLIFFWPSFLFWTVRLEFIFDYLFLTFLFFWHIYILIIYLCIHSLFMYTYYLFIYLFLSVRWAICLKHEHIQLIQHFSVSIYMFFTVELKLINKSETIWNEDVCCWKFWIYVVLDDIILLAYQLITRNLVL